MPIPKKKTYKGANYTTTVYDNLEIKTVYSSTAISMTFNFNYKTWRSSTPVSYSILSDTFSRTEFTSIKTVDEIKTLTISNVWKTQSGCNSGFPFIKEMYW